MGEYIIYYYYESRPTRGRWAPGVTAGSSGCRETRGIGESDGWSERTEIDDEGEGLMIHWCCTYSMRTRTSYTYTLYHGRGGKITYKLLGCTANSTCITYNMYKRVKYSATIERTNSYRTATIAHNNILL